MSVGSVAAVVVGLSLIVAGVTKLADRQWKAKETALGTPTAVLPFLPPLEIVLGALVAARVARLAVAVAAMLLLVAFTLFLIVKWDERSGEPCNCFGVFSKRPASKWTLLRNVGLIGLALVAGLVN